MPDLLRVHNLTAEFRSDDGTVHRAVDGVSFSVANGEVVGVMGESGCGKTTLALSLLGLHDSTRTAISGAAFFRDRDLLSADMSALRRIRGAQISLVSQEPAISLCPVRRIGDQIAEVFHAHSKENWKACRAEAEAWLERVGLEPVPRFYSAYPHQLSGGQLQRVVLAQALICTPELLIADEPTASLDAQNQIEFVTLLRTLKSKLGTSVLLISHTPEIQASLADRVLVMRAGRIVEQGGFAQIFRNAISSYTRAMIHPAPRPKTDARAIESVTEYVEQ